MGEGYSLPDVGNQQLLEKVNKLLKTSDDETQKLVKDYVKHLLKENETLKKEKLSLEANLQKQQKINSATEKELHKCQYDAQKLPNVYQKDPLKNTFQKMHSLEERSTINLKKLPPRSFSLQENSDKACYDAILPYPKERNRFELEIQKLQEENEKLRRDKKLLAEEKDNALSRLSQIAGAQLTKGNTNIVDLSDGNRHTKLAEKWSTLYTDEWTDAYDVLKEVIPTKTDDFVIEKLLCHIVQDCYNMCKKIKSEQTEDINCLPQRQNQLVSAVQTKIVQHFAKYEDKKYHGKVIDFIKRCAELCWHMVIKDPSMVLKYDKMEGKPIDRNDYSVYTKSGPLVDFVIWPALYLHEDGPLLSKGVVQCKSNQQTVEMKRSIKGGLRKQENTERQNSLNLNTIKEEERKFHRQTTL